MTKFGVAKDECDTPMQRMRHRDGKLLRGGIGLTTGLGWCVGFIYFLISCFWCGIVGVRFFFSFVGVFRSIVGVFSLEIPIHHSIVGVFSVF